MLSKAARIISTVTVVAVLGGPLPALAAGAPTPPLIGRADVHIQLFTDETQTTLVDEFAILNEPASSSSRYDSFHNRGELAIPIAGTSRGVDVVGTVTGRSYRFSLNLVFFGTQAPGGTSMFATRADWRVTARNGGLVSDARAQSIDVFARGNTVVSKFAGRTTGLYLVGTFLATWGPPMEVERSVFGTGEDIELYPNFNYTGSLSASARGLIPAVTTAGTVAQDPGQSFSPGGAGTTFFDVDVPAGTTYAQFSLFDAFADGANDLDLYLYFDPLGANTFLRLSGGPSADEQVFLTDPAAGTYRVWVHGYTTDGPDANFTLFDWVLGTADAGNMEISAPAAVTNGTADIITLSFTGLAPATKYVGTVVYSGFPGLWPTIVSVDTP